MKKTLVVAIALIVSLHSFSQSYSFKKVFGQVQGTPATFLKVDGKVTVTDSLITFVQNGQKSETNVVKVSQNQYKSKISEDQEIRFSFTPDFTKNDNQSFLLVLETKDRFSGSYSSFTYYLKSLN